MSSPWLSSIRVTSLLWIGAFTAGVLPAADAPAPPESPLKRLAGQLAQKRPPKKSTESAPTPPSKEELLRPEFRFKPARNWLMLPQLAEALGTNEEERAAVLELMNQGTREAKKLLAAEGADNDVAAATALFMSQLWQVVRQEELLEAHVDVLHAQIVGVMAGPEVAKMPDADKQRYWEFCLGYPIFILGMAEVLETDEQRADLRTAAAVGFETLIGVRPELVDIGPGGLSIRAGVEEAAEELKKEEDNVVRVSPIRTPEAGSTAPTASPGSREKLPASGPAISGLTYTPPEGWTRENVKGDVLLRATLGNVNDQGQLEPNNTGSHQATLAVLSVLPAPNGPTALFDEVWRYQFAPYELGDTIVHYRGRLTSNLVVLYMGRFFQRPNTPKQMGNPQTYGALWLVDLGDNRFQPVVALVEPRDSGSFMMDSMKESVALKALSIPLGKLLGSIKPAQGAPPYPAGGYFAAVDLRGHWTESSSAFGGFYVNANTGAGAGAAVTSSGGNFHLNDDGTYAYDFAFYSANPQFGNSSGSTKHSGRYRLDGDIVLVEPSKPISYTFTCCAVGIGSRQTPNGVKRILVTVTANRDGQFFAPPLIPNWDSYHGTMTWYMEK